MADVKFAQVTQVLPVVSTGTQIDIDAPVGFGIPKAVIAYLSRGADVVYGEGDIGIGWYDGTTQQSIGATYGESDTNTETSVTQSSANLIQPPKPGVTTSDMSWRGISLTTDKLTIEHIKEGGADWVVTVVFIGGADVANVAIGSVNLGTGTSPIPVALGFEPTVTYFTTIVHASDASEGTVINRWSYGIAVNDGLESQRTVAMSVRDDRVTAPVDSYIGNDCVLHRLWNGEEGWRASVSNYSGTGFDITSDADSLSSRIFYLALELTGADVALFSTTYPGTTGNYVETQAGFEPTFGHIVSREFGSYNTYWGQSNPHLSVGMVNLDATSAASMSVSQLSNVTTPVAKSRVASNIRLYNYQGTADSLVASGYTLDSNGWTFTLTTNPTSDIVGFGLAIGPGAPAGAVLDTPTIADLAETTVTIGCSTDTAGGTLYWYVSESATEPSAASLKDGTGSAAGGTAFGNQVPGATGAQTAGVTALTADTDYWHYWIQETV